jgi:hypothetical protein
MFNGSLHRGLWRCRPLFLQILLLLVNREAMYVSDPVQGLGPGVLLLLLLLLCGGPIRRVHAKAAALDTPLLRVFAEATTKNGTLIQMLGGR